MFRNFYFILFFFYDYVNCYLAGRIKASNSAAKCLLIMFLAGGIPNAVAIVSPLNEGSSTTKAPCTPLSRFLKKKREMVISGFEF